ncbi:response regulator [Deinococcus sp. QL22]|uniref:response regulator n=1 Tax=Deinococcus sp. QL22 TaxID=2939437 RepID=UPI002017C833|nr:response regulator [Deinococcus sp. QL22]UQN10099.1 response regulator [Deinococcus sp. QL22]
MTRLLQIWVIDDHPADLFLTQQVFATLSDQVTVTPYQSAQAALDDLRRPNATYPDVLLLDINMPQLNGFDVLRAMKADDRLTLIPVVMLTTSEAVEDIQQAYALFASAYLVKSVDFSSFIQQVESLVTFWAHSRLLNWSSPNSAGPQR